jgi:CRP-like cAMP-binding protein
MSSARVCLDRDYTEVLEAIRARANEYVYGRGTVILRQGESSDAVYLIGSGLVKVTSLSSTGGEVIIGLRPAGRLLGAESAILQGPHMTSAVALTTCNLCAIGRRPFIELLHANPKVSWYLHELHSREILELAHQRLIQRTSTLRQRFAHFLSRFATAATPGDSTGPMRIEIPLKQQDVAQLLSVTPEHFSRLTSQLEQDGVIHRQGRFVTVVRPGELFQ